MSAAKAAEAHHILMLGALSLAMLVGLTSAQASADDDCGGVLMAKKTLVLKEHKALVQKLGR